MLIANIMRTVPDIYALSHTGESLENTAAATNVVANKRTKYKCLTHLQWHTTSYQ